MEDWDLQAVVRGSTTSEFFASVMNEHQDDDFFGDLIKGFEPKREDDHDHFDWLHQMPFSPDQGFLPTTTASSVSLPMNTEGKKDQSPELHKSPEDQLLSESSGSAGSCSINLVPHATKWKRSKKNEQKKVVQQVAAEGLSSDMWAWRKYGQKPIKGSPYPRSYYRCSSLKGCMARKQVERSISDPSIFIVTYTAEHSHGYPPRRNALAGSTRSSKSLSTNFKNIIVSDEPKFSNVTSEESSKTPSVASTFSINEDEFLQPEANENGQLEEQAMLAEEMSDRLVLPDNMLSDDDFYPSLGDFEGLLFD